MIYADDPLIKELFRRIEYLEKKVKDINIRTMPVQPLRPLGPQIETPVEALNRKKAIDSIVASIVDGELTVTSVEPSDKPVVIDDKDDCLGCQ